MIVESRLTTIREVWRESEEPWFLTAAAAAKSLQSCPTLWDPIDGSPLGCPIPGSLQARTLEWVAISFSSAWKWKVKGKSLGHVRLLATPWTAAYQAPPSMGFSRQEYWSGVPLLSSCYCFSTHICKGVGSVEEQSRGKSCPEGWQCERPNFFCMVISLGWQLLLQPVVKLWEFCPGFPPRCVGDLVLWFSLRSWEVGPVWNGLKPNQESGGRRNLCSC